MREVLLWLDRFDLDGKQITTRSFRCHVQNKQMPLRKVHRVDYGGEFRNYNAPTSTHSLSIRVMDGKWHEPADVALQIETDADVRKAASHLYSCFVPYFCVYEHSDALPNNAIICAPARIRTLDLQFCNFDNGERDSLSETLSGSTFKSLRFMSTRLAVWQMDDRRLESLRLRGCDEFQLTLDEKEKFQVTEEGMLAFCFTQNNHLPVPECRFLDLKPVNITPAFFKKAVEASKTSQLTCEVMLCLADLRFDVGSLDLGVLPSRSSEYDRDFDADVHHVRYNFAVHGNGIRLLIHFNSEDGEEWNVTVRHGKKNHNEFFEPKEDEDDEE